MLFDERQLDGELLTVTQVNSQVRSMVEKSYADVGVLGEISNFKRHTSGHLYFTLKDSASQLRVVCFRSDARRISADLEDGMKVVVRGKLTVYEAYGQYQLVARTVEPTGVGELELAFRALREKLEQEGLFDPAHKKPLPAFPFKIAVVTSPTGAAIRDVIATLRRRWPCADIVIHAVRVQGDRAAQEIAGALERLARAQGIDIVIMGRGGGSLEDLWAFNEEQVARAIYACPIPVISAVGHETDFTIADFVADVRAATPTMAAEIAVPRIIEVMDGLRHYDARLGRVMNGRLQLARGRLNELLRSYALGQVRGRIESYLQSHDYLMEKLFDRAIETVRRNRNRLGETLARLSGLDARSIMSRGYTLCSDMKTGRMLRSAEEALDTDGMRVTFHDGNVVTEVKEKMDERK